MRFRLSVMSVIGILILAVIISQRTPSRAADDCDRACLNGFVDQYLTALVARDPSRLPLARNARYTENGVPLELGDGMWAPQSVLGNYRLYFTDPKTGQVGFFGTLEQHRHPAILGLRLKVESR